MTDDNASQFPQLDRIDTAIGDGPALTPVDQHLRSGQRALRRRRIASAAVGGLAVAAVAVTGVAITSGMGDGKDSPQTVAPATQPSADGSESDSPAPTPPAPEQPANGDDVGLSSDGTLLVRDGVEVIEQINNPLGAQPPEYSMGVSYRTHGKELWTLLETGPDGSSASTDPARKAFATLDLWVDDQVAVQIGEGGLKLVRFAKDGSLVPLDGVEILEQRSGVMIPDYTDPDGSTVAALVTFEGNRWWIMAWPENPPRIFPVSGSVGGKTMDDFIAYVTAQVGGGEGLR
ncbi:hypothetical protein [Nocardioides sp. GXZ039]|uniref:hypothetical protein n=1 Tax=Nocardioides sp. GXZ039 TaxID=3136018 RepID=UPI0030F3CF3D